MECSNTKLIKGVAQKRIGMRTMDILFLIIINAWVFCHSFHLYAFYVFHYTKYNIEE